MYSSHLRSSFKERSFYKVRVVYNNCFRILFKLLRSCSASQVFLFNDVLSFGELLRKSALCAESILVGMCISSHYPLHICTRFNCIITFFIVLHMGFESYVKNKYAQLYDGDCNICIQVIVHVDDDKVLHQLQLIVGNGNCIFACW